MKSARRITVTILLMLASVLGVVVLWGIVPGWANVLLALVGTIAVLYGAVVVWAYLPSRAFEPFAYTPTKPDYWPTGGFRPSTPEAQGMDSAKLLEIAEFYAQAHAKESGVAIDSISIVRHGYMVAEFYFNPLFPRDTTHVIHSCTKSIMSALIGIAIERGYIESVDVPMVTFFPDKLDAIDDPRMGDIILKDLLSMQTGIRSRDSYLYRWAGVFAQSASNDWESFVLGLPIDTEPGSRFDYSNLSSFMLSAIVCRATGMDTLTFARRHLFDPLGIEDVRWERSPEGVHIGYARMWLKPHDMAKLGMLYLQQGVWDGQQIVPAAWVKASVTPQAFPKDYVEILDADGRQDRRATSSNWVAANFFRPFADGYGYQWWLDKSGAYTALGVAGQYIMVVPEHDLVMVVTSSASDMGVFFPKKVLDKYVLPAIRSSTPLPPNRAAQRALAELSEPPRLKQTPQPAPPLPDVAWQISGQTYSLEANNWHFDNFKLVFDPDRAEAQFGYTARVSDSADFAVGLDGVYRFTDTAIGCIAAVGEWSEAETFDLTCQQIGYSAPTRFRLTFRQDAIEVTELGQTGSSTYSGRMQRQPGGAPAERSAE